MGGGYATAGVITARQVYDAAVLASKVVATLVIINEAKKLAEEAEDDLELATDTLVSINRRREELADTIHKHNLKVTLPFQKFAMRSVLDMDEMNVDYGGLCSYYQQMSRRQLAGARVASSNYMALFCVKESKARRELDYFAGVASVDSAYARVRNQQRREELMRNIKSDAILGVHSGTFTGPSGVFGLIESAAQVYGYIQNQASGQLSGALALVGYGAGAGISSLSGGSD